MGDPSTQRPTTQLKVTPLHPTFTAEVEGVDWTKPIDKATHQQIQEALDKV